MLIETLEILYKLELLEIPLNLKSPIEISYTLKFVDISFNLLEYLKIL